MTPRDRVTAGRLRTQSTVQTWNISPTPRLHRALPRCGVARTQTRSIRPSLPKRGEASQPSTLRTWQSVQGRVWMPKFASWAPTYVLTGGTWLGPALPASPLRLPISSRAHRGKKERKRKRRKQIRVYRRRKKRKSLWQGYVEYTYAIWWARAAAAESGENATLLTTGCLVAYFYSAILPKNGRPHRVLPCTALSTRRHGWAGDGQMLDGTADFATGQRR